MTESPIKRQKPGAARGIGELFEATWDAFKPNAIVLVGATVIMSAASLVVRQLLGQEFLGSVVDSGLQSLFFWAYAIDSSLGPVDSLRASWGLTRGRKWGLILLSLAMAGVVLTGLVAFRVGIFAAVPFVVLAQSILFVRPTSSGQPLDAVAT